MKSRWKPLKLNHHSFVHKRIRQNVDKLCTIFIEDFHCYFECVNLDDELYGFLIFRSDYYVFIVSLAGIYCFSSKNELIEISSQAEPLIDSILFDIKFLSLEYMV